MSTLSINSTSDSMTYAIPKHHNDRSNWSNYELHIQRVMGSKGLWRHVEGTAISLIPYALVTRVPVQWTEQHQHQKIKLRLGRQKSKTIITCKTHHPDYDLDSSWFQDQKLADCRDAVKVDATTKNMLFLLDAKDQYVSMKLSNNKDPKAHLTKIKQHFLLMAQHHDNLIKMELTIFDSHYNTTIMSSLPDSYLPILQTIMATECASTILGMSSSNKIKPNDLIAFIIKEAQHHIFNDKRTKTAKSALAALGRNLRAENNVMGRAKKNLGLM